MSDERKGNETVAQEKPKKSTTAPSKKVSIIQWVFNTKIINRQTCKFAVMLILVVWITNPSLIPFLPSSMKDNLTRIAERLLGDVKAIRQVLPISWVKFFQIVVMVLFLCLIAEITKTILNHVHLSYKRIQTLITVFLSTMKYIFAIIGIIWALRIMGINTSVIFAGVGIVSLIVGFSANSLIADVVTGVFLLFDNQYNIGDIIDVGSFHGEVVKIGFRSTSLKDQGGNIKIINNSNMRDIINRSEDRSRAVCDISLPITIELNSVEKNISSLLETLGKTEGIFLEPPEYWGVESIKGQEMIIRIVAWVDEHNIYQAQRIINRAVKLRFQTMGVWG